MNDWIRFAIRLVFSALVLMLVGLIVPGFRMMTFWHALIAAAVIAAISYLIDSIVGENTSPYSHGVVSFLVSALVIYVVQFFVPGMSASILGALLAAVVIGIIDMFVPTVLR